MLMCDCNKGLVVLSCYGLVYVTGKTKENHDYYDECVVVELVTGRPRSVVEQDIVHLVQPEMLTEDERKRIKLYNSLMFFPFVEPERTYQGTN